VAAHKNKNVNRLLDPRWGNVGGELKLWDRDGRLWTLARNELDRDTVEQLYGNPNVPVAVAEGAAGLDWVEPAERKRRWSEELGPRTFDDTWTPPHDAPGALPFEALEFRSGEDRLLLFFDYD
jgi:hypothetical protein